MLINFYKTFSLIIICLLSVVQIGRTQSPDSRICNCFSSTVSPDFMLATKAIYGTVGITINRNDEVKPNQSQQVKFVIPKLPIKQGCGGVYKILIRNETGATVFETEDSHNEFTYSFPDCNKTYSVTLMATAKASSGSGGNCSRTLNFTVIPQCNTAVCNCDSQPASGKFSGTSINMNVEGKLSCGIVTATRRSYALEYKVTNKTNCRMTIESISVLEETINGNTVIVAKGSSIKFNTGISTALSKAAPTGNNIIITVRYKLNERSCTAVIKLPYVACR